MHRSVILVGDITDHAGTVLTGSSAHKYGGRLIARVGDTVSCPTHGNNAIVGKQGSFTIDGQAIAVEGMTTACGSRLIASQTMFNTLESKQDSNGTYKQPLWNKTSPIQPTFNPYNLPQIPEFGPELSAVPPDNVPVVPPVSASGAD